MAEMKMSLLKSVRSARGKKAAKAQFQSKILGDLQRESQIVETKRSRNPRDLEMKPIDNNPMMQRRFRFRRSAAGAAVVTADSLLNLMGVATGSSAFKRYFGTMRLLKVEGWTTTVANVNGTNNMSIEFYSDLGSDSFDQGPPQVFASESSGTSIPGHICVRPGVLCKLGRPVLGGQATGAPYAVFRTLGNPGDIVEVTVEFDLVDAGLMAGHSLTGSGGFAGFVLENTYLDNTSTSGTAGTQLLTSLSAFQTAIMQG